MLIKVAHESPISLLEKSQAYNDFDYALVHLFSQYPAYYEYFVNARNIYKREILLDNSIFELGKAFDSDLFLQEILKLKPNMYIVPDVLENTNETILSFSNWLTSGKIAETKKTCLTRTIGAIQGKNWHELVRCYRYMSDTADMIAISFDFSYYEVTGFGWTQLEKFCSGRQRFISQLIDEGIWNWNKPHHLLGCSLAREFRYYVDNDIYNIVSCDTSNPIIAAMHNIKYDAEYGLPFKPPVKLADLIDHELTPLQVDLVDYNVNMFKKILHR